MTSPLFLLAAPQLQWESLPPLPDREGFAGAFAGVSNGSLLVAGGANFPEKKPWDGGKKVWHDTVFALEQPDGSWKAVGRFPGPRGYGVSVSTKLGMICIGGSDAERHYAETFVVSLTNGVVQIRALPNLPLPLANTAGALIGETIYLCAGSEQPGERSASRRFFALDLSTTAPGWTELEPFPGRARILPAATALRGAFCIVGGAAIENRNDLPTRVYLRDAWCYEPGRGWEMIPDLPRPVAAAASPAPNSDSQFFIIGGDDGTRVGFTPPEQHPGFPGQVWIYNAENKQWSRDKDAPFGTVTLPTVFWEGRFILPSGEVRPGVRSPKVWTLRIRH